MKYPFLILLLCLLGCTPASPEKTSSPHQKSLENSHIKLTAKTNLDADVELEFVVYYRGSHDFNDPKDLQNQNINKATVDSLRQFSVYEMYGTKLTEMESLIEIIVENEFKKSQTKIERVELWRTEISEEDKKRISAIEAIKRQSMDVKARIYDKKRLLEDDNLTINKNLSKTERAEIEKEILTLEKEWELIREKDVKLE